MKKIFILMIMVLSCFIFISCANNVKDNEGDKETTISDGGNTDGDGTTVIDGDSGTLDPNTQSGDDLQAVIKVTFNNEYNLVDNESEDAKKITNGLILPAPNYEGVQYSDAQTYIYNVTPKSVEEHFKIKLFVTYVYFYYDSENSTNDGQTIYYIFLYILYNDEMIRINRITAGTSYIGPYSYALEGNSENFSLRVLGGNIGLESNSFYEYKLESSDLKGNVKFDLLLDYYIFGNDNMTNKHQLNKNTKVPFYGLYEDEICFYVSEDKFNLFEAVPTDDEIHHLVLNDKVDPNSRFNITDEVRTRVEELKKQEAEGKTIEESQAASRALDELYSTLDLHIND